MKFNKLLIIFILIIFFKTETVFSENELFNVNNIKLEKRDKLSNSALADKAIKKGFSQLIARILLKEDVKKISDLNFSTIKQLVTYYQISNISNENEKEMNNELVSFSITFDKDKIHDLFYKRGILYAEISDKELFVLPIVVKNNEVFIFNKNFFYSNWNLIKDDNLVEFILPLENIEIIKNITAYRNNLISLDLNLLFKEYSDKNLALILIEENKSKDKKIFIKSIIQGKNLSKNLDFKKKDLTNDKFNEKIIIETKNELVNLVKSKNLIDIRTPSFINAQLNLNKKNNLVELNSKIQNIDLIEDVFVQEFNSEYVKLRIKYLGKLEKVIRQLKKEKIILRLVADQWIINH